MNSQTATGSQVSGGGAPLRLRVPTTTQAAIGAGALLLVYSAIVLTGWPSKDIVAAVTDIAFPVMSLVNVLLAALAAGQARGRLRLAWAALTVGLTGWAAAELIVAYREQSVGEVPFPSWADAGYLSFVPGVVVALLLFPSRRNWRGQSRMVLDGLIVTLSLFLISWFTVMRAIRRAHGGSRTQFALQLAYPAADVLVVALGLFVLVKAPAGLRVPLGLLAAGLACSAAGNGVWAYLGDPSEYKNGGVADIFYAANFLLIGLALLAARHATPGAVTADASPGRFSLWLPLVPVAVATVFAATAPQDAVTESPVIVAGALLIVATLFRQFMQSAELVRGQRDIRHLADRLTDELDSAADYVASILPGPLAGPVDVCSRYLPARAVGGDSFGYEWIDDDHLIVYLIDVSGHGVRPALLSVSVHNLLRSGALSNETLRSPERVLSELNSRFAMDDHDDHYFTMWFGVYRSSTGRISYATAGHPPPLLLTQRCVPLAGSAMPIGMFADAEFTTETTAVPAGAQILLYSDGMLGDPPQEAYFTALCAELAAAPSCWLDELLERRPPCDDDCSLVLLRFSGRGVHDR